MRDRHQRDDRRGHAADREAADDPPIDGLVQAVDQSAGGLGGGGVEQIGADRRRRMNAEKQHQDRRHQRPAPHAGLADQQADEEAREHEKRIEVVHTPLTFAFGASV
jgi:hypothetical protein